MDFREFVQLTRPIIGGKSNVSTYVKTIFDAILTEAGKDILEDYSSSTYKAYANGSTSINKIAKAINPHVDSVEFESFINDQDEAAQIDLCKAFSPYEPDIDIKNVSYKLADLLKDIIKKAAETTRKKPTPIKDVDLESIKMPEAQSIEKSPYSPEDDMLLKEFNEDYDSLLLTLISENYSISLTNMTLPREIEKLYKSKWKSKANAFLDLTLKSYVFGLLGELNTLSSDMFTKNATSPFIKKSRTKIRNLYVKLHPQSFDVAFPYEVFIDDWNDGNF
ncbi:MAG: hypothetical protein N4Q64_01780 [Lactobacillus iners]|nr:hypothetical protein [Lactobacillus iners]